MATFYTAKFLQNTSMGMREVTRDFFLPDPKTVREEIANMGGIPLSIRMRKPAWYEREYISPKFKRAFLRSLSFHVQAGMSPGRALWIVIEGESDRKKRVELEPALEVLRRGGGFMTAIKELKMFDRSVIAVLTAGEKVGALREVIESALQHMEEKGKTWKMMTAAIGWLWFDISSSVSTVIGVQFGYLPWLEQNGIDTQDMKLKAEFESALQTAYYINGFLLGVAIILCLAGVFLVVSLILKRGALEEFSSKMVRKMPVIRSFVENTAMAESFGIVGRMLKGRVQLDECLKVAADSTPVKQVKQLWLQVLDRVMRGDTIDRAFRNPIMTRSELIEIGAHQNSEQLANMFLNIAQERGEQSKKGLRQIVVGGVAFVILYTFLAAGAAMWVLWVQNKGLTDTLQGISGGY
jgi:type II secretory pathway component PulF